MGNAKRDANSVPTLLGVSSVDGITPTPIQVDPVTGRVLVEIDGSGSGDRYKTTSTTSQTIVSSGSLTFTVDSGLSYIPLQDVIIVYDASNHMHGTITSYSGTTLIVSIQHKTGSGTYASWTINLDAIDSTAVWGGITGTLSSQTDLQTALDAKESTSNKDATGGYAGLTLFKINFKNVANTFTSFFTNSNTASRTYTFPDKNGTVAMTSDIVVSDGDKGDITVSSSGTAWIIDNDAVTYAKMQNVSATNKVLGRTTDGAGDIEEIDTTGSGNVVRATSPTLVTPALGTPASGTLTNCTFPTLNQDTTGKSAKTDALQSATTTINVSSATAPTAGQVLTATSSTSATWQTVSGTGDFVGPASSTDNAIVRMDGTTGKLGQNSTVTIDDTGNVLLPDTSLNGINLLQGYDNGTWKGAKIEMHAFDKEIAISTVNASNAFLNRLFISGGVATSNFQILNSNVGINETSPDYKLDINGTFGFTPGASVTPVDNGDIVVDFPTDNEVRIRGKGSDATIRSSSFFLGSNLQEDYSRRSIIDWAPTTVTAGLWSGTAGAGAGTYATTLPTTTSKYTTIKRARYANIVTTANQVLGQRNTEAMFFIGGTTGHGGYLFRARLGFDIWTNGGRFFAGMHSGTTVISADPSSLNNTVGFCVDVADNGLIHFLTRSTSATKASTTLTITSGKGYDVEFYIAPNGTTFNWSITDINAGTTVTGSATATLPTNTTMLTAGVLASNGALTPVDSIQLGVNKIYISTNL